MFYYNYYYTPNFYNYRIIILIIMAFKPFYFKASCYDPSMKNYFTVMCMFTWIL